MAWPKEVAQQAAAWPMSTGDVLGGHCCSKRAGGDNARKLSYHSSFAKRARREKLIGRPVCGAEVFRRARPGRALVNDVGTSP